MDSLIKYHFEKNSTLQVDVYFLKLKKQTVNNEFMGFILLLLLLFHRVNLKLVGIDYEK